MSKKDIKRAERVEEDRVESARKSRDKAESAERSSKFEDILSDAGRSIGCCEPCNYHVKTESGEFRPCKMSHEDAGPDKQVCADCSETHYRPKK
jgi:hypothetical protein